MKVKNLSENLEGRTIIDRIEPVLISLSSDESCDDSDDYESSDTSE